MKRLVAILFLIIPAIVFGNQIIGGPGSRIMGFAPRDTLIDTLDVTIILPARIGLYVNGNTTFDLSSPLVTYPPALYPGYYDPTAVAGTNTDGVDVQVFSNSNTMTWYLQTQGLDNLASTIALDQLYYAPDGTANPPDGNDPPGGGWVAFTNAYVQIASGLKTSGWVTRNQDYVFQAEIDDEPTGATGEIFTIFYRLYAQ